MPHVFISYVRENQKKVDRLCNDLTQHGVKVWLDRNDIKPGVRWKQAIHRAIRDGAFFIACFSLEYNVRSITYMNEELTEAIEILRQRATDESWFIPVKLNKCGIPDRSIGAGETLEDLNYVELYKDWDTGIQRILDVIQPIPAEVQTFMDLLDSDDQKLRIEGARKLAENGHVGAVPALVEALGDEARQVRLYSAKALWYIGDVRAISALAKALDDESDQVSRNAAIALRMIATPEAPKEVEEYEKRKGGKE